MIVSLSLGLDDSIDVIPIPSYSNTSAADPRIPATAAAAAG